MRAHLLFVVLRSRLPPHLHAVLHEHFVICYADVVFGQVVEGMGAVGLVEAAGSTSGRTRAPVVVVDCGEIKGKLDAKKDK
eukprot:SAG22_NODE_1547_length_4151_cov_3.067868_4_plen_81_part_00